MTYYFFLLCLLFEFLIAGEGNAHPVDISFMVADVKYSKERGVQICEIQHGIDSLFKGEAFSNGGSSLIAENFADFFSAYNKRSWAFFSGICDHSIKETLKQNNWKNVTSLSCLLNDSEFISAREELVEDPEAIAGYRGFVFAKSYIIEQLYEQGCGSSFILVDRGIVPVWRDKYKVSLCLSGDPLLETCKPKWNLYQRKDHTQLADEIISDLGADCYVIKPRDKFCGQGVVIVEKENLKSTLEYIFSNSKRLKEDPDRAYRAWYKENADTFLVEEFVPSDPVIVPHLGMEQYCPTVRIVFLAVYEQGHADIRFLGGYNCLPEKSLSDTGNLHQKYKASLKTIHSSQMDSETYAEVIKQLYEPLRLFYKNVLEFDHHNSRCESQ